MVVTKKSIEDFELSVTVIDQPDSNGAMWPYMSVSLLGCEGRENSIVNRRLLLTHGPHLLMPYVYSQADYLNVKLSGPQVEVYRWYGEFENVHSIRAVFGSVPVLIPGAGDSDVMWIARVGFCRELDDLGHAEIGRGFLENWFSINPISSNQTLELTRRYVTQMQLHCF